MYNIKNIYEAKTVKEANTLLSEHPNAEIIAGGSDVLIKIREGKKPDIELVSIYLVDEIRGISYDSDEAIRIGSLTSFSHITKSEIIKKHINVLGEAVDMIGGPQIRNIGTIGGNTCNGVTSADSASTLFALDAVVELQGINGVRKLPISEFYIKAGTVDLRPTEVQTALIIPKNAYKDYYGHYIKYAMRDALDIATTGCSVNVKLSSDNEIFEDIRIAYGVAGPIPLRAKNAENEGKGKKVCKDNIQKIACKVLEDINPRDSWRASKEFREHIAVELAKKCLFEAVRKAGGKFDDEQ